MRFEVGKKYITRGGWAAELVLIADGLFWFTHLVPDQILANPSAKLYTTATTAPIAHEAGGAARYVFALHAPPAFFGHPADIVGELKKAGKPS